MQLGLQLGLQLDCNWITTGLQLYRRRPGDMEIPTSTRRNGPCQKRDFADRFFPIQVLLQKRYFYCSRRASVDPSGLCACAVVQPNIDFGILGLPPGSPDSQIDRAWPENATGNIGDAPGHMASPATGSLLVCLLLPY